MDTEKHALQIGSPYLSDRKLIRVVPSAIAFWGSKSRKTGYLLTSLHRGKNNVWVRKKSNFIKRINDFKGAVKDKSCALMTFTIMYTSSHSIRARWRCSPFVAPCAEATSIFIVWSWTSNVLSCTGAKTTLVTNLAYLFNGAHFSGQPDGHSLELFLMTDVHLWHNCFQVTWTSLEVLRLVRYPGGNHVQVKVTKWIQDASYFWHSVWPENVGIDSHTILYRIAF